MADLGPAQRIEARTTGPPGQREFRLWVLGAHREVARLKLEKQHLLGLRVAIDQVLSGTTVPRSSPDPSPDDFDAVGGLDLVVGRLGVGFSEAEGLIVLEADEIAPEGEKSPFTLRFAFNRSQAARLAREIDDIIASGRALCPLCGQPIDPTGHVCIRSNGHSQEPVPEPPDAEEP